MRQAVYDREGEVCIDRVLRIKQRSYRTARRGGSLAAPIARIDQSVENFADVSGIARMQDSAETLRPLIDRGSTSNLNAQSLKKIGMLKSVQAQQ